MTQADRRTGFGRDNGAVLLETATVLPVILLSVLLAGQFAHIWYARQMVCYAAYCAARSSLVYPAATEGKTANENAIEAAKAVCSLISLSAEKGTTRENITLPWVGEIKGSQDVAKKMSVTCTEANKYVKAEVTMQFPLVFPVANRVMSGLMSMFTSGDGGYPRFEIKTGTVKNPFAERTDDIFPHIVITETAVLPKPYTVSGS